MQEPSPVIHEPSFAAPEQPAEHLLGIRFTGSGSEYFRIWIVNLLLTIVTLSFYHPWAKVRRLRYFYGNTLVDGHALDFHGDPMKMLRGYLLVGLMVILYSLAGKISPMAGLVAFVIVAGIWPALLKASMHFRLANTSWRGLRFRFKGTVSGAYKAMLPLFIPGLLMLAVVANAADPQHLPAWYLPAFFGVTFGSLLVIPWMFWSLKKYLHDHYALGQVQTELKASPGSFYAVFLKTFGVAVLASVVMTIVIVMAIAAGVVGTLALKQQSGSGGPPVAAIIVGIVSAVLVMIGMQLLPRPYFESRLQNLVWGRTQGRALQFRSELRFGPLFWLTLKNWFLMIITIGLYWPFAKVALARIRLEAVSVTTRLNIDQLSDPLRATANDAAGDAAGDLFGIDIGL